MISSEELRSAAAFLRKYAAAVEAHLYMRMKTDEAHFDIVDSLELAQTLDAEAIRLHIVSKAKQVHIDPGP